MIYTLRLTKRAIDDMTHVGECEPDVRYWLSQPRVSKQLDRIPPDIIRADLREYGAWDAQELSDEDMNRVRFLWACAGNMREEKRCSWEVCG